MKANATNNKSNDLLGYVWEPLTMTYTASDKNCGYGEGVQLNLSNSQLLTRQERSVEKQKPSSTVKKEREISPSEATDSHLLYTH